jgi:DNA-binding transcriptional regulator LsrR (DeoR family)
MPQPLYSDRERLRRIHRILVMFYQEGRSQAQIAADMGLSAATVNRMVREGHEQGLVEIRIRAPFEGESGLTKTLERLGGLDMAVAVHSPSSDPAIVLGAVAEAAAAAVLDRLEDGMTIAVSGGVALCAVVAALAPTRRYDVTVVPATGGVQGKFRTDVNHVAVDMAERLGGRALQLHAPVFCASEAEREALLSVSTIASVLDVARGADIALFGVGSVAEEDSTYRTLTDVVDHAGIAASGATGELLAHLIDAKGKPCDLPANRCLVALPFTDLRRIPHRIAVASGARKSAPLAAVLRTDLVGTLVTDDQTAREVVAIMGEPAVADA